MKALKSIKKLSALNVAVAAVTLLGLALSAGDDAQASARQQAGDRTQTQNAVPASVASDKAALVALYNATGGANWADNTNWLSDKPLSEWYGVYTDDRGRVRALYLEYNLLSGKIPSELENLTQLKTLHLGSNQLSGDIPRELENLTELDTLIIADNSISDISPLSGMPKLRVAHLHTNNISDLAPLAAHTGLAAGSVVDVRINPIDDASRNTHIPALQGRGVTVRYSPARANSYSSISDRHIENADGSIRIEYLFTPRQGEKQSDLARAQRTVDFLVELYGTRPSEPIIYEMTGRIRGSETQSWTQFRPQITVPFQFQGDFLQAHEVAHVFTHHLLPTSEVWFDEGISVQAEGIESRLQWGKIGGISQYKYSNVDYDCWTYQVSPALARLRKGENVFIDYPAQVEPNYDCKPFWLNAHHTGMLFFMGLEGYGMDGEKFQEFLRSLDRIAEGNKSIIGIEEIKQAAYEVLGKDISPLIDLLEPGIAHNGYVRYQEDLKFVEEFFDRHPKYAMPQVSWTDIKNEPPVFISPASFEASENQTMAGKVTATDPDDNIAGYAVTGGTDGKLFTITASGVLTFIHAPDFEVPGSALGTNEYRVQVTVTSSEGDRALTAAQLITVTVADVAETQSITALEALYNAADGPNWTDNTNWSTNLPSYHWYGVETDSKGHVTGVDLSDNGLSGQIPPELGSLSNLEELQLDYNQLTGGIPSELGSLSNLTLLRINENQLTGNIPSALGSLYNLTELHLDDNRLSGEIPSELRDLSNLTHLRLNGNRLSGGIPADLNRLSRLEMLHLFNNQLSGSIPSELSNLSNLKWLSLSGNQLTGTIPTELGNLSNLEHLYLGNNQLTGCIPAALYDVEENDLENLDLPVCDAPPPADPCVESVAGSTTISGSWASEDDCPSANKSGSYARYYTFTITTQSNATITLASSADTVLLLLSGAGRDGANLHENDDHATLISTEACADASGLDSNDSCITNSSLAAGDYTIEATSSTEGAFTLTVSLVSNLLKRYDVGDGTPNSSPNNKIDKSEALKAIEDYLFYGTLTKAEVLQVIELYLFG